MMEKFNPDSITILKDNTAGTKEDLNIFVNLYYLNTPLEETEDIPFDNPSDPEE